MAEAAPATVPFPAGPRRLFATMVLVLSNLMVVLDITIANVSVPHIAGSLGASLEQGTWVITSYAVAEAITVPLTGWLTQRFGPVRLYVGVMTGFAICSFLCSISLTLPMIVAARIGQGLCGGLVMPLAQTLLMRIYPREELGSAMLMWTMTILLGPAIGPNLGGFISDNWSWHWIFLINLPIAAMCITSALAVLRPAETPLVKVPIDRVGLALLIVWVGSLQLILDIGRTHDWFADPLIVALAVVAAVGFCAFLIWELTEEHPVVNLRVFRHRGYTFGVMALTLCFGAYFASIVLIPQWLQTWQGYPAQLAGMVIAGTAITALTTGKLASKVLTFADPRLMVSLAVLWLACMSLVRSTWTNQADFWTIFTPQLIQGFGMSFFMLPLTTIALASVDPAETASAAGIQNFVRTLSIGVATALTMAIWDNTQRAARVEIAGNLNPEPTVTMLTDRGFSIEQARGIISQIVEREAVMIATDYVFLISAVVFLMSSLVVWLAPRPARAKPPAP